MKARVVVLTLLMVPIALPAVSFGSDIRVRFATFNVSLYDQSVEQLAQRLASPQDSQAKAIAEIIQRVRPDVLLLNEFDYNASEVAVRNFLENYLSIGQNVSNSASGAAQPIQFAHSFCAPPNTGIPSGYDLDRDGKIVQQAGADGYGRDCWGYGEYPGKYGMVLLSRYPIDQRTVRTFRKFKWRDMPHARLPDNPATEATDDWYSEEILDGFPLSSKSHWDVPIKIAGRTIHILASHPTPPTYDGPEDRNGRRNHDEIRFWFDYIGGNAADSAYIYDDRGKRGGLETGKHFVIMGDLNGDPADGEGAEGIKRLLGSMAVNPEPVPASEGGAEQARLQGGKNNLHRGDPNLDTLDAADEDGPGNLRVDYVIPARTLKTLASGVFWPKNGERQFSLVGTHPFPSSDHRLVWIDIELSAVSDR